MNVDWKLAYQQALPYDSFLQRYGSQDDRRQWAEMQACIELTAAQRQLLGGWVRKIHVLCVAGAWCGDCVQQCPIFDHFARACPVLELRLADRDAGPWKEQLTICGGARVPQLVFLDEDHQFLGHGGDRTLAKYRQLGRDQLGPACPTGIGAPPPELTAAVVQDWLDQFERIHWIVRLSPRLRQRHGD